jgi:hypothetical protein
MFCDNKTLKQIKNTIEYQELSLDKSGTSKYKLNKRDLCESIEKAMKAKPDVKSMKETPDVKFWERLKKKTSTKKKKNNKSRTKLKCVLPDGEQVKITLDRPVNAKILKCSLKQKTSSISKPSKVIESVFFSPTTVSESKKKTKPSKVLEFGDKGYIAPADSSSFFSPPIVSNSKNKSKPSKPSKILEFGDKGYIDKDASSAFFSPPTVSKSKNKSKPSKILEFGDFFSPPVKKGRSSTFQRSRSAKKPIKISKIRSTSADKDSKVETLTDKKIEAKVEKEIDNAFEFYLAAFEETEKTEDDIATFVENLTEDILEITVDSGLLVSYTYMQSLAEDLFLPLDFTSDFVEEWVGTIFFDLQKELKKTESSLTWDTSMIKNSAERAIVESMKEIIERKLRTFQKKVRSEAERSQLIDVVTDELVKLVSFYKEEPLSQENFVHVAETFMLPIGITEKGRIMEYVRRLQERSAETDEILKHVNSMKVPSKQLKKKK